MTTYEKAFICGRAFALGVAFGIGKARSKKLALDFYINNPKFAMAENGKTFAYDPDTHETSGLGEGKSKKQKQREHTQKSISDFYTSTEFKNVKGKEAIDTLLKAKTGYVKDAFYSKTLGENVDLVWGDSQAGLEHIIEKHGVNVLDNIDNVVTNGSHVSELEDNMNYVLYKDGQIAVISKSFKRDGSVRLLVTSYEPERPKTINAVKKLLSETKIPHKGS